MAMKYNNILSLCDACRSGDVNTVIQELKAVKAGNGCTALSAFSPLYIACQHGHLDVVNVLLENVNANETLNNSVYGIFETAMHAAAYNGNVEIVRALLEKGHADVNLCSKSGPTPLFVATMQNHTQVVSILLAHGAGADVSNGDTTPLFFACQKGLMDIIKSLVEVGNANPNKGRIRDGTTPFQIACVHGHTQIVVYLLEKDIVDVNKQRDDGYTPLHSAAHFNRSLVLKALITLGHADVNIPGGYDYASPLYVAAANGNVEAVETLLYIGHANPLQPTKFGGIPIYVAKSKGYLSVVRVIELPIITFLLGHHPRCGAQSFLQEVPPGLLVGIARLANGLGVEME